MKVSFLDLKNQYRSIKGEVLSAIEAILNEQKFILGPFVEKFEEEVKKYLGVRNAIGVASGSDAILISLMAIGIEYGDTVITTPYTFFATAGSISRLGAIPVFVDIDISNYNIDPNKIEDCLKRLNKRPKAIIPVHLYGQATDIDSIMDIVNRYGLYVIEDAAQAFGAIYKDRKVGTTGDLGCFSFYPSKNLGGYGDGGMIVTNNDEIAKKIKILRVHGSSPKYFHNIIGLNSRLDAIQAGILSVKMKYIDGWNKMRNKWANLYNSLFIKYGLLDKDKGPVYKIPIPAPYNYHIYHQYVIAAKERDKLKDFLKMNDIGTEIYYPLPLHMQECYKHLGYSMGDFPNSEYAALNTLALPIYPEINEEIIEYVVSKIKDFYSNYLLYSNNR
jgi:dTDP-4-amino-4,6-dideoxygalactose transaminase